MCQIESKRLDRKLINKFIQTLKARALKLELSTYATSIIITLQQTQ